jgi:PHP family Zn ribbon phosphoesterase
MNRYYYDFHIHSCLSPCADNDMTPNNLAGMAALAGLNIMALTDHNSSRNCPAFFAAAKKNGIIPVAGMELTTAEDIHVVCLFEHLEDAMSFNDEVDGQRVPIRNRADIFGDQLLTDENDEVIGREENLLTNATQIPVDAVPDLVKKHHGVCYPAHIDREANGIVSILGTFPADLDVLWAELHDIDSENAFRENFTALQNKRFLAGSDAHYLWDIPDKRCYFELEDEPYSGALVRKNLFRILRGEDE